MRLSERAQTDPETLSLVEMAAVFVAMLLCAPIVLYYRIRNKIKR